MIQRKVEELETGRNIDFYSSKIGKFTFFAYLFFVFFGTSMPFRSEITSADDIALSNPVNQYVFSSLYVLAFFSLLVKRNLIIAFIKKL